MLRKVADAMLVRIAPVEAAQEDHSISGTACAARWVRGDRERIASRGEPIATMIVTIGGGRWLRKAARGRVAGCEAQIIGASMDASA